MRHVKDLISNEFFIINSGAKISIVKPTPPKRFKARCELISVDGFSTSTYGNRTLDLSLVFQSFIEFFVVVDVKHNILAINWVTGDVENSFERENKAGVIQVDLTAAYDTLWHQGVVLMLLQKILDKQMVCFLSNILANQGFVLKTSDGHSSRPRRLRNGVPQGLCLSPMLFNIYISEIPKTKSRQNVCADDLSLCNSHKTWHMVEEVLTTDTALITEYL